MTKDLNMLKKQSNLSNIEINKMKERGLNLAKPFKGMNENEKEVLRLAKIYP